MPIMQRLRTQIRGRYHNIVAMRPNDGGYRARLERHMYPYPRPMYPMPPVWGYYGRPFGLPLIRQYA
jgi:hypothetical protein